MRFPIAKFLPLFLVGTWASAATFQVGPESRVTFKAASTLHGFHGSSDAVTGSVEYDAQSPLDAKGKITIDARTLVTGNRKRDRLMHQEALETEKFPWISVEMRRFVPHPEAGASHAGNIHANLNLHGKTKKILIPAEIEPQADGSLKVQGSVGLDMTEYDVEPTKTRVFLATLRVLPNVSIRFDLDLKPEAEAAPHAASILEQLQ